MSNRQNKYQVLCSDAFIIVYDNFTLKYVKFALCTLCAYLLPTLVYRVSHSKHTNYFIVVN